MSDIQEWSERTGNPVHYLHPEAAEDFDFEGAAALCDHVTGRSPRDVTMASSVANEVNCQQCLNLMNHDA